jgi:copper chaperone NosL
MGGLSLLGAAVLPACSPAPVDGAAAAPQEITAATACALDGMLLADYPGPKAQIRYAGEAEATFFCDTVELFNTLLRPEQVKTVVAAFVQDMSLADWYEPRGHWIEARNAWYVEGSRRRGAMGTTFASFGTEEGAQRFAGEYGGRVMRWSDVRPEMVDLSGGALHDTRM